MRRSCDDYEGWHCKARRLRSKSRHSRRWAEHDGNVGARLARSGPEVGTQGLKVAASDTEAVGCAESVADLADFSVEPSQASYPPASTRSAGPPQKAPTPRRAGRGHPIAPFYARSQAPAAWRPMSADGLSEAPIPGLGRDRRRERWPLEGIVFPSTVTGRQCFSEISAKEVANWLEFANTTSRP